MENMENIKTMQHMAKIDFHTHILPNIDDGSQSIEQSYRMLELEKQNGVAVVIATPHFYPDDGLPADFVYKRQKAYNQLKRTENDKLPIIKLGAEVLLGFETAELEDLSLLAIEGTNYILIEMPYSNWQPWVYEAIERIQVKHHLRPIIAHVERYVTMQTDTEQIYELLSMQGVLGQMNTRSIMNKATTKLCHKMLQCHMVHVIGSDAHRGQHLTQVEQAYHQIIKKHGIAYVEQLDKQAQALIQNEEIIKKDPIAFKRILGRFYQ